ncbi:MAG: MoaD/ThiS family protein [Kiritimatiellae bacterium]|nr:MoaD/ThiS family protein [Kiritimatiellia bacterium]MBP5225789.1 MoaD/ThiS family protein [Kiritimatiellia bacterium]
MKIIYQGKETETGTTTVTAFLAAQGVKANEAVIEYNGEILSGQPALDVSLQEGAELNVFRIVAGG